jgi:dihydroorotate dehydrogenase (fumarate)
MGLRLRNPLVASASPLTGDIGRLRALEDHGAGAVVLPSLFEEEIVAERQEIERCTQLPATGFAEAQSYFPARVEGVSVRNAISTSCAVPSRRSASR